MNVVRMEKSYLISMWTACHQSALAGALLLVPRFILMNSGFCFSFVVITEGFLFSFCLLLTKLSSFANAKRLELEYFIFNSNLLFYIPYDCRGGGGPTMTLRYFRMDFLNEY